MNGIRYGVLEHMLPAELTDHGVRLMIYLSLHQNVSGYVCGMKIREISKETDICYDRVYQNLYSLREKGLVWCEQHASGYGRWKIGIVGNEFSGENDEKDCIDTGIYVFRQEEFWKMSAKSKLLCMEIIRRLDEDGIWHMNTGKFIKRYGELLNVSVQTLRIYIRMNKFFFDVRVRDKEYWFSLKTPDRNAEAGKEF